MMNTVDSLRARNARITRKALNYTLKEYIKASGVTQEAVAEELGIHIQTLYSWLRKPLSEEREARILLATLNVKIRTLSREAGQLDARITALQARESEKEERQA